MHIISLKLENFQGIKSAVFEFNGQSADIFGPNASGKTTIKNAHCWLLFGRSGDGVKNYTPKTNDIDGGYLHNLEHAAEEALQLDDGRVVTLRRVYKEVYKKKRGSAQDSFDGNTVEYYINGVPTPEKDYDSAISKLSGGDIEKLKILTIPEYFPSEMTWQARRQILLDLCGDITDEDVISSSPELADLPVYLAIPGTEGLYTIEEYRRIAAAKKTEINGKLKTIPARIDEAERATPNTSAYSRDSVTASLNALRAEKEKIERERAESRTAGNAAQQARLARQKAESDLAQARSDYLSGMNELQSEKLREARKLEEEADIANRDFVKRSGSLRAAQDKMNGLEALREQLLAEYDTTAKQAWDAGRSVCPTCKRPLPEEEVAKLREEFNLSKSKKLEAIRTRGKSEASADMIKETANAIGNMKVIIESLTAKHRELTSQAEAIRAGCVTAPFETTEEYKKLSEAVTVCKAEETESSAPAVDIYSGKLDDIDMKIRDCEAKLINLDTRRKQLIRMEELREEEKKLGAEFETLDAGMYLCEAFIRQKVRLLTDSINSRFSNVRFRLFVDQVNGGLREDCEVMIPSPLGFLVPYSTANGGAKIIAGIEIIKVLSEHWCLNVPLFVDNAESITSMFETGGQMVRLTASREDEALRVELYENEYETAEAVLTAS
jgi:hypothetical protein